VIFIARWSAGRPRKSTFLFVRSYRLRSQPNLFAARPERWRKEAMRQAARPRTGLNRAAAGAPRSPPIRLAPRRQLQPAAEFRQRFVDGEARSVGGDLEQRPVGLAIIDGMEVTAIHDRTDDEPARRERGVILLLAGVIGRAKRDVVHRAQPGASGTQRWVDQQVDIGAGAASPTV